jgi:DNA-binding NarL/FixJ family response regulator
MIVDDHPMWRQTLRKLLQQGRVATDVIEATDGPEALRLVAEQPPDLVLMDVDLPGMNGIETTRELLSRSPSGKILVLSAGDEPSQVLGAVRAGAVGYLIKTTEPLDLLDAVRRVKRGEMVFPPELADIVLTAVRATDSADAQRLPRLQVVVADASALFRDGVSRLLDEAGFDVVGKAGNTRELLHVVNATSPDVVLTDVRLPVPGGGTDNPATEIHALYPSTAILVLSQNVDLQAAAGLLETSAGGVGYLLKEQVSDAAALGDAIRRVATGESVLDPQIASLLVRSDRKQDPLNDLTEREREVMALMAEGRTNQAISDRLFLSVKAIEAHVRSIFTKLGLEPAPDDHRRVLAVLTYLRSS